MNRLTCAKLHVCGNDIVLIDADSCAVATDDPRWSAAARDLCDRHHGVGADQLVLARFVAPGDVSTRILNPDGSEAPLCGNALICLASEAVRRHGAVDVITIATAVGARHVRMTADGWYAVDLGQAQPRWDQLESVELERSGETVHVTRVDTGTAHAIVPVEDVDQVALADLGPWIERHPRFAPSTNVMFISRAAPDVIRLRPWERGGTGASLACGTGAGAAAFVTAARDGLRRARFTIECPGGTLRVALDDGRVELAGRAMRVFDALVDEGVGRALT